ncbi:MULTISPECIES: VanZ family protein [Bacillaceae]|uniref:VanZ family protein n=1 Tax=Evansella alkalicola TaxID=745819 RepID=A0ABS6JYZ0_9BACI|nr:MULTISPECIES: VanZ family protein [Bacillaceae]MBU9723708.1 VanZ family protein [Bacillus alkalicola]
MRKTILVCLLISQPIFFLLFPVWLQLANYLHSLVIAVVWICISFASFVLSALFFQTKITVPIKLLHIFMAFYTLALLILLFFRPGGQSYGDVSLIPFETIAYYLKGNTAFLIAFYNLSANIGLFIPFGIYYCYVATKPRLKKLALIAIGSVCVIEITQFLTKRGSLDIDDLILNVLGVCLGYSIYPLMKKVFEMKRRDGSSVHEQ